MKQWEFMNCLETNVIAADPADWPDKDEAAICPPGWLLLIDAENEVFGMAPKDTAMMLMRLFNEIEKTNRWEDPDG